MPSFLTLLGFAAAFGTTAGYVPQVRKAWQTGSTGDLSFAMLGVLSTGVTLWLVYGVLKGDAAIITANAASLVLLLTLVVFKVRQGRKTG